MKPIPGHGVLDVCEKGRDDMKYLSSLLLVLLTSMAAMAGCYIPMPDGSQRHTTNCGPGSPTSEPQGCYITMPDGSKRYTTNCGPSR
jgi:hypothetical protein